MGGSFIDSLTALLMNEMFLWVASPLSARSRSCLESWDCCWMRPSICGGVRWHPDAVAYPPLTEAYRRTLAYLERDLAARCEVVLEASFGHIICHRGQEAVRSILKEAGL